MAVCEKHRRLENRIAELERDVEMERSIKQAAVARRNKLERERESQFATIYCANVSLTAVANAPTLEDARKEAAHPGLEACRRSLARRDKLVAAEALEELAEFIRKEWIECGHNYGLRTAAGQALLRADWMRQQAEGVE